GQTIVSVQTKLVKGRFDVRFGSKADICTAAAHVRFTPNSDRESEFPQRAMSALPPKADMCSALAYVRFGPKADMEPFRPQALICSLSVEDVVSRERAANALKGKIA